jgi:class 3 adenylate cyclase
VEEGRVERRLAAILAADVVGFSRLMGEDEAVTWARLKTLRAEVFDPTTKKYGGRIFKNTGDGALAEFSSAVEATLSAIEVQRALAARNADIPEDRRIELRIGISLGDVMVDGDDLYGNGVNVAARMETLSKPGGVCVSGNVYEHRGPRRAGSQEHRAASSCISDRDRSSNVRVVIRPGYGCSPTATIDRCPAFRQPERRSGAGILRGWHC